MSDLLQAFKSKEEPSGDIIAWKNLPNKIVDFRHNRTRFIRKWLSFTEKRVRQYEIEIIKRKQDQCVVTFSIAPFLVENCTILEQIPGTIVLPRCERIDCGSIVLHPVEVASFAILRESGQCIAVAPNFDSIECVIDQCEKMIRLALATSRSI